jgi:hypothetical protein
MGIIAGSENILLTRPYALEDSYETDENEESKNDLRMEI